MPTGFLESSKLFCLVYQSFKPTCQKGLFWSQEIQPRPPELCHTFAHVVIWKAKGWLTETSCHQAFECQEGKWYTAEGEVEKTMLQELSWDHQSKFLDAANLPERVAEFAFWKIFSPGNWSLLAIRITVWCSLHHDVDCLRFISFAADLQFNFASTSQRKELPWTQHYATWKGCFCQSWVRVCSASLLPLTTLISWGGIKN